ncbi:hypothetical protein AGMMS50296_7030 [Alphaproteobacteria bacterium]|nr:hypothetical protein AGMMS50296_7030 [Alphaproteobacteria bacterium]
MGNLLTKKGLSPEAFLQKGVLRQKEIPLREGAPSPLKKENEASQEEIIVTGTALSFGLAVGQADFYKVSQRAAPVDSGAIDVDEEKRKIKKSIELLRENISRILSETAVILTEESLEIFDVYRILIQDVVLERELVKIVETGKSAYEATEMVARNFRQKMHNDSFWQTRLYDLQYLLRQLREFLPKSKDSLADEASQEKKADLLWDEEGVLQNKQPLVLIAPYISPADLLYYYRYRHIVGLVLKDAGQTSHAAIVARSLHIPTLGGIYLTKKACPLGARLLLDTHSDKLYIHPAPHTLARLQHRNVFIKSKNDELPLQTITKDNIKIELHLNANLNIDFDLMSHPVIHGVGLFRTEILFMMSGVSTDFYAQAEEYRKVFDRAGNKPVIFRTVDTTDDKELASLENEGLRGHLPELQKSSRIRSDGSSQRLTFATSLERGFLKRYEILQTQIRALLRARIQSKDPYGNVYIMIPMISDVVELKAYQKIIETEALHESKKNPSITSQIKIGLMIEVPSIVYQISHFSTFIDFISIGTNDLFQFFFATNRWNTQSRRSQDMLAPAFLKFIGNIVQQFMHQGISIHVCGEMASDPLTAMTLLGLGVRKLSIASNAVNTIAHMINSLPLGLLYPYTRFFRMESREFCVSISHRYESAVDVRHTLQKFAHENHVLM